MKLKPRMYHVFFGLFVLSNIVGLSAALIGGALYGYTDQAKGPLFIVVLVCFLLSVTFGLATILASSLGR